MENKVLKPKIRFKGFTDTWEQRKFKNYFDERNERTGIGEMISVTISSGIKKFSELNRYDSKPDDLSKYKRVVEGDIAYNSMRMWQGASGYSPYTGILSPAYTVIKPKDGISAKFFSYQIKRPEMIHQFELNSQGLTKDTLNLKFPAFSEIETTAPIKVNEQNKIAKLLEKVDNLITLHQSKYDKLVNVKKALLEKMFPKDGKNVPEIRFKGFTDTWEQHKFSRLANVRRGLTYSPIDISKNGVRVLRSSNIQEDKFIYSEDDVFVNKNAINIDYVKNNDILITSANGSTRLVGKHALISGLPSSSAVHGGFMLLATANENPEFLNASMSSSWYSKFIELFVSGGNGAIGNLSKSDLDEQEILVPSSEEQKKLGQLFKMIDNLITLHQHKLEKLKNMKKSLLNKMFI